MLCAAFGGISAPRDRRSKVMRDPGCDLVERHDDLPVRHLAEVVEKRLVLAHLTGMLAARICSANMECSESVSIREASRGRRGVPCPSGPSHPPGAWSQQR